MGSNPIVSNPLIPVRSGSCSLTGGTAAGGTIRYACDRAFPLPEPLRRWEYETIAEWKARLTPQERQEVKAWRRAHRWHPHQLRHSAATLLRREFGLEAAQLPLGHASAQITDAVYAERDRAKVIEVMRRIG